MGEIGDGLEVQDVAARVPDGLAIDQPGPVGDRRLDRVGVVGIDEGGLDTHTAEGHVELGERTAVKSPVGDYVVTSLADGEDREELGGHP